jgi:hypothetical protein
MRKKAHQVGDTIYLRGIKGKVTAVDAATGKATVHAQTSGALLGSAPAYKDMPVRPADFKWPENTFPARDSFTVILDDYAGTDFDAEPVPAEEGLKRSQASSQLGRFKEDYWKAVKSEDSDDLAVAKKAIEWQAVVAGADTAMIFEGKCGIDGCGYPSHGGFEPDHFALSTCRSGKHNHCTCDSCF